MWSRLRTWLLLGQVYTEMVGYFGGKSRVRCDLKRVVMSVQISHFHSGGIYVHGGVVGLPVKGRAGDVPASGQSPRLVMTIIDYCCC